MSFSDIPIRDNGDDVDASWWNIIRSKLVEFVGGAVTGETQLVVADNQSSYADITGLSFNSDDYIYIAVRYSIYRTDGGSDVRRESGVIEFTWDNNSNAWIRSYRRSGGDDSLNVADALDVSTTTTVGQAQYKSDSMGGTYVGKMRWKIIDSISVET